MPGEGGLVRKSVAAISQVSHPSQLPVIGIVAYPHHIIAPPPFFLTPPFVIAGVPTTYLRMPAPSGGRRSSAKPRTDDWTESRNSPCWPGW